MQGGTRFTYPGGMEDWVDLVDLIAPRPGVEPATPGRESDAEPLNHQDKVHSSLADRSSLGSELARLAASETITFPYPTLIWYIAGGDSLHKLG